MISYTWGVMIILLRSASHGAAFLSTLRTQLRYSSASPCRVAGRQYHSASTDNECIRSDPVDAPTFAIYYNDVYEVDLPTGHRFPMQKYRIVREGVQAKVDSLREDEKARVSCGEIRERLALAMFRLFSPLWPHRSFVSIS